MLIILFVTLGANFDPRVRFSTTLPRDQGLDYWKMAVAKISDQVKELVLILDESQTVWNRFHCIREKKCTVHGITNVNDQNVNFIYAIRLLIATVCIMIGSSTTNVFLYGVCTLIWCLVVLVSILDCNYSIFLDSFTTFDVYYKAINIAIGVIGSQIVDQWFVDYYTLSGFSNKKDVLIVLYCIASIEIIGNMMVVWLVSLYDGLAMNPLIKFCFALIFTCFYIYKLMYLYFFTSIDSYDTYDDKNNNTNINLHSHAFYVSNFGGYYFDWRIASMSCISTSILFIIKQYFQNIIRKRVTLINCFISINATVQSYFKNNYINSNNKNDDQLELTQIMLKEDEMSQQTQVTTHVQETTTIISHDDKNSNGMNDDDDIGGDHDNETILSSTQETNLHFAVSDNYHRASKLIQNQCKHFSISIDSRIRLFYWIFNKLLCINNEQSINICVTMYQTRFRWLQIVCEVYVLIFVVIDSITGTYMFTPLIKIITSTLFFFTIFYVFLSLNYQMFCYQLKSFIVWWKFIDALILRTSMIIIDYSNDVLDFDSNYYSKWQRYYLACIDSFGICLFTTVGVSMANGWFPFISRNGIISHKQNQYNKFSRGILIIFGIIIFTKFALIYGKSNDIDENELIDFGFTSVYIMEARHFAFLKSIDLSLWFAVQFVRQWRFPNSISWQNIIRRWRS